MYSQDWDPLVSEAIIRMALRTLAQAPFSHYPSLHFWSRKDVFSGAHFPSAFKADAKCGTSRRGSAQRQARWVTSRMHTGMLSILQICAGLTFSTHDPSSVRFLWILLLRLLRGRATCRQNPRWMGRVERQSPWDDKALVGLLSTKPRACSHATRDSGTSKALGGVREVNRAWWLISVPPGEKRGWGFGVFYSALLDRVLILLNTPEMIWRKIHLTTPLYNSHPQITRGQAELHETLPDYKHHKNFSNNPNKYLRLC